MTQFPLIIHPTTKLHIDMISQNLPHALILNGPSGVGIATIAKQLARHHGSPSLTIEPKKKGSDGKFSVDFDAGSMIIDDIRELYSSTRTKHSQKHVYVFDFGDRTMSVQAQNAFLKLLEEPQDGMHFILATHRLDKLLPTIISRSQTIQILPVLQEQTDELLKSVSNIDQTKRSRLQFIAKGLPAEIIRLQEDDAYYEKRIKIMQDAKTMISGTPYEKLLTTHAYKDDRNGAVTLLSDMMMQLTVVLKSTKNTAQVAKLTQLIDTQDALNANGNIRLHLARCVV